MYGSQTRSFNGVPAWQSASHWSADIMEACILFPDKATGWRTTLPPPSSLDPLPPSSFLPPPLFFSCCQRLHCSANSSLALFAWETYIQWWSEEQVTDAAADYVASPRAMSPAASVSFPLISILLSCLSVCCWPINYYSCWWSWA